MCLAKYRGYEGGQSPSTSAQITHSYYDAFEQKILLGRLRKAQKGSECTINLKNSRPQTLLDGIRTAGVRCWLVNMPPLTFLLLLLLPTPLKVVTLLYKFNLQGSETFCNNIMYLL